MNDTTEQTKTQDKPRKRVPATTSQKMAWMKALLADRKISSAAKNVALALLMRHNDKTGQCNPRHEVLAQAVGVHRPAIGRSIKVLEESGWITAYRRGGSSDYVLHVEKAVVLVEPEMSGRADSSSPATDEERCPAERTADVRSTVQQMSGQADTEPSFRTIPQNHLSLRAPASAKAEREKSASGGVRQTGSSRKPSSQPTAVPMPANFDLTPERESIAMQAGIRPEDIRSLFQRFKTHAKATGRQYADWNAGWEGWCLNAVERQREQGAKTQRTEPKPSRYKMPRSMMR